MWRFVIFFFTACGLVTACGPVRRGVTDEGEARGDADDRAPVCVWCEVTETICGPEPQEDGTVRTVCRPSAWEEQECSRIVVDDAGGWSCRMQGSGYVPCETGCPPEAR